MVEIRQLKMQLKQEKAEKKTLVRIQHPVAKNYFTNYSIKFLIEITRENVNCKSTFHGYRQRKMKIC